MPASISVTSFIRGAERTSGRAGAQTSVSACALSGGYGAEIAARVADEWFAWLVAPVRHVASTDTFVAYAPALEDVILPQAQDVAEAVRTLHRF